MAKPDTYSYAPRGMSRKDAARYVGVSITKFDEMVADGRMPRPKRIDGRVVWDRLKIEAAFTELPIDGNERDDPDRKWKGSFEPSQNETIRSPGGYPIVTDPTNPVKKYYDRLGFDPATMGTEDLHRLSDAAQKRWRASIPGTPLGKRERSALDQLAGYGVGVAVSQSKIKGCSADTEERLQARGYIETQNQSYSLTESGYAAWQKASQSK